MTTQWTPPTTEPITEQIPAQRRHEPPMPGPRGPRRTGRVVLIVVLVAVVGLVVLGAVAAAKGAATAAKPAASLPPAAPATVAMSQDDLFMADFLDTPGLSTTMSRADTLALAHSMCGIIGTPGIPSHAYLVQQLGTSKLGPQVTEVMLTAAEANLCPQALYAGGSALASSAAPAPAAPSATTSQSNAVEKAESYLSYSAFSRTGLIKQLKFEQFSTADATYAVDHVTVDWTAQADLKAKSYMEYSSFSRGGLIKQLKFEGFTQAQAEHGAKSVGL